VILRHGKPAAAIVPARLAEPRPRAMPLEEVKPLLDRLTTREPEEMIEEALGRNRWIKRSSRAKLPLAR
jgi:hypothetical protein